MRDALRYDLTGFVISPRLPVPRAAGPLGWSEYRPQIPSRIFVICKSLLCTRIAGMGACV